MIKRSSTLAVALAILLSGCGGGGSTDGLKDPGADTAQRSASPTAEPATLQETCPGVESALIAAGGADWLAVPTMEQARQFGDDLQQLADAGDQETKNALRLIQEPIEHLAEVDPAPGMETIDASRAVLDGLDAVADRCAAVGSSALQ